MDPSGLSAFNWNNWEVRNIREMFKRDGRAVALFNALTLPLLGVKWDITPAPGDTGEAVWLKDFLTRPSNQGGMSTSIESIVAQMANAIAFRRAFFEKVWQDPADTGGEWLYDKIAYRPADNCRVMRDPDTGSFRGFTQDPQITTARPNPARPVIRAMDAFVYFHNQRMDPINGASDMEVVYWAYEAKQRALALWYEFLTAQATNKGLVMASDLDKAIEVCEMLVDAEGGSYTPVSVGSSDEIKIETIQANDGAGANFKELIDYLEHSASLSVLAGFMDLTAGNRGSAALSTDQSDFFLQGREAVAREMETAIRDHLLADLVFLNKGFGASVPYFKLSGLAHDNSNVVEIFKAVSSGAVVVPTAFIDQLTIRIAGLIGVDVATITAQITDASFQAQRAAAMAGHNQITTDAVGVDATVTTLRRLLAEAKIPDPTVQAA